MHTHNCEIEFASVYHHSEEWRSSFDQNIRVWVGKLVLFPLDPSQREGSFTRLGFVDILGCLSQVGAPGALPGFAPTPGEKSEVLGSLI